MSPAHCGLSFRFLVIFTDTPKVSDTPTPGQLTGPVKITIMHQTLEDVGPQLPFCCIPMFVLLLVIFLLSVLLPPPLTPSASILLLHILLLYHFLSSGSPFYFIDS